MWRAEQARLASETLDPAWEFDVRVVMQRANCDWFSATEQLLASLDVGAAVNALNARPHPLFNSQDMEILKLRQRLLAMKDRSQADEKRLELQAESLRMQIDQHETEFAKFRDQIAGQVDKRVADEVEKEISLLRRRISVEEESIANLQEDINTMNKEMSLVESYTEQLERDVSSLRTSYNRVQSQIENVKLEAVVNDLHTVAESENTINLERENSRLRTTVQSKGEILKTLIERQSRLKETLRAATAKNVSSDEAGVGVQLSSDGVNVVVASVNTDGPAYAKGVGVGDHILEIDGISTVGMSAVEVASRIRGRSGSIVVLKILPNGLDEILSNGASEEEKHRSAVNVFLVRSHLHRQHFYEPVPLSRSELFERQLVPSSSQSVRTINRTPYIGSDVYSASKATPQYQKLVVRADGTLVPVSASDSLTIRSSKVRGSRAPVVYANSRAITGTGRSVIGEPTTLDERWISFPHPPNRSTVTSIPQTKTISL